MTYKPYAQRSFTTYFCMFGQISLLPCNCNDSYTVYVLIEVHCTSAGAWVQRHLLISIIKPVVWYLQCPYTLHMVNRNHMDLCLQGSGSLCICGSQTDRNIAKILVSLDDLLCFIRNLV